MNKIIIITMTTGTSLLSILSLSSCDTKWNGCPKDVYEDECLRQIIFKIYNSDSTENLLAINSWDYDTDSVKIFNEEWKETEYAIDKNGDVYLNLSLDQELSTDKEFIRTFYISLEKKDVDTIQFNFQLKYECDYFQYIYFKPFYNHSEHQIRPVCGPRFRFYKN